MNSQRVVIVLTALLVAGMVLPVSIAAQGVTPASTVDFAAIDDFVEDQMEASRIPGVALAIVEGDRIVHADGYGWAGEQRRATPQTPFPVGSLTKSFTALAVMQLVEAGKIDLDAPVQRYLPWFQVADPDASARITIRHLLNQTSGLSRATGAELYLEPLLERNDMSLLEAVRGLAGVELNRPVGTTFEYSNANYAILAFVVETVTGEAYGAYLQSHILGPLGMQQSSATTVPASMASLYRFWFGMPLEIEDAYGPEQFPGGYLVASAEDMARYLTLYLGGGSYQGEALLSPSGIDQLLTPATNEATRRLQSTEFTFRYGMGWFAGPFGAASDARWHLGELPYFTAWMVLLPERNQALVVLINAGSQLEFADANEVMSRIPIGVVNILEGAAPPTGRHLSEFYVGFDLIVLTIVAIQVWALIRLLRRPLARMLPERLDQHLALASRAAPLLWEFGLSATVLLGYPMLTGADWWTSLLSIPDLTVVLLATSTLWLSTGVIRFAKLGLAFRTAWVHSPDRMVAAQPA